MNKKVTGIIAVVVGGAVAGLLGFHYWTRTPRYAVANIRRAIIHHDAVRFRQFVDLDQALTRGIAGLKQASPTDLASGPAAEDVSGGFVEVLSPFLVSEAKKRIEHWVETGDWGPAGKAAGAENAGLDLSAIAELDYVGLKSSARDGAGSLAVLDFHHTRYDAPIVVEVRLSPGPGKKLMAVEIANLPAIVTELSALESKWREDRNRPAREKLDQTVRVVELDQRSSGSAWVEDQRYHISITLENTGTQVVEAVEGDLAITPLDRPELAKTTRAGFEQMGLAPGQTRTYVFSVSVGALDESDHVIFAAGRERLQIGYTVRKARFEDGAELELPH